MLCRKILLAMILLGAIITAVQGSSDAQSLNIPLITLNQWDQLYGTGGIAVDSGGNLYIAYVNNNTAMEIYANGTATRLGGGFYEPQGIAVDPSGNVYVADTANSRIVEIYANGSTRTLGSGFQWPKGVAVDSTGNVYVTDIYYEAVYKIDSVTGVTSKLCAISTPEGIAIDSSGNLYVVSIGGGTVYEIYSSNLTIRQMVPAHTFNFTNLVTPGVAVDSQGNVYVADNGNNAVKAILTGGSVIAFRGIFDEPCGIAVGTSGHLFVLDNYALREFIPGNTIPPVENLRTGMTYSAIQAAIDDINTTAGDTLRVKSGTYKESISVNKAVILQGRDIGTGLPVIDGMGGTGVNITSDDVKVQSFNVTNSSTGIYVTGNNASITDNILNSSTQYGIYLSGSSHSSVIRNFIGNNSYGVYLTGSSHNSVTNNRVENNGYGVYLTGSSNNVIWLNVIRGNSGGNAREDGSPNAWNSSTPVSYKYGDKTYVNYTGNYWGDYTGTDLSGDGIGDTPYTTGTGEVDYYPMIQGFMYNTYFSPGTYTFTVPDGVTSLNVTIIGGGGGGGGGNAGGDVDVVYYFGGCGGGGGSGFVTGVTDLAVTPGQVFTVTVGSSGIGGVENNGNPGSAGNGGIGGMSSFGTYNAFGGKGGEGGHDSLDNGGDGLGGAGGSGYNHGTSGDNYDGDGLGGAGGSGYLGRGNGGDGGSNWDNYEQSSIPGADGSHGAIFICNQYAGPLQIPMVAGFSANVTGGDAPLTVLFNDTTTGYPVYWNWSFGDGTANVTSQNASHTFSNGGTYDVVLTAANGVQASTAIRQVQVNTPLKASFTANMTMGKSPLTVQFNDTSTGYPWRPSSWEWNFGDGPGNVTGRNVSHTFTALGKYRVLLTAINGSRSSTASTIITVSNSPVYAYIPNAMDNNVSVIDTASNRVVADIAVGTEPIGVAVSPDGTKVFITNAMDNSVSVIDTGSNQVTANITVGSGPVGVAASPDGSQVYVANYYNNSVSVIDTGSNQVTANITVLYQPWGIAVSPDGTKAYVTCSQYNLVSVIDTASDHVVANITVGYEPVGVAISPDGTRAYVTNLNLINNSVSVIDTASDQAVANIPVGSQPLGVAVSPDGTKVFVANSRDSTVSVIDTASGQAVATIPAGNNPVGVAVSMDGSTLYVVNSGDNNVYAIDPVSKVVNASIGVGNMPYAFGQFLLSSRGNLSINAVPATVLVGSPADVAFNVISDGVPVCGVAITLSGNATGSGVTNASGIAVISVNAMAPGNILATASMAGYTSATTNLTANATPLLASFTSNVTSGNAPLTVQFTDTSTGSPDSWKWYFGDNNGVYVADSGNGAVKVIYPNGTIVTLGNGFDSVFEYTCNVAVDAGGNVYVADNKHNVVFEIYPNGTIIELGSGFVEPSGIEVDASGNVYVADSGNDAIKKIYPNGTIIELGSGFSYPLGVTVDAGGNVYVADSINNEVKEIYPNGTVVTLGSEFDIPGDVAVDISGNVYVADIYNNTVKVIYPNGTIMELGGGFVEPSGVDVDAGGNVYVADTRNNAVKVIYPNGTIMELGGGFDTPGGVAVMPSCSVEQNPVHTYTSPGTYTVSMTASSDGGSSTLQRVGYITVLPPAIVASFTSNVTSGTAPLDVQFNDTSMGPVDTWEWSFGDGSGNVTAQNATHTYVNPGVYQVNLTVTGGARSSTASTIITVENAAVPPVLPVASFDADVTSGVAPLTVHFTDYSTGPHICEWDFGDGSSNVSGTAAVHTYNAPGTYTVTMTASNSNGSSTMQRVDYISVSSPPVTSFTIDLKPGWNLVSFPLVNNTISASSLGSLGVSEVSWYNNSAGGYDTYIVGLTPDDFNLRPDRGYFLYCDRDTSLIVYGDEPSGHSVSLYNGWNMAGWSTMSYSDASEVVSSMPGNQEIARYNTSSQGYDTYVEGLTPDVFAVRPGEGYFIYSDAPVTLDYGGF